LFQSAFYKEFRVKRVKKTAWLALASVIGLSCGFAPAALAQLAVQVTGPDGKVVDVTGRNVPRGDESLVIYNSEFGSTTKTNGYGVEVVAIPASTTVVDPDNKTYEITQISTVWDCAKDKTLTCGSVAIPKDGIVLSGMGSKRDWLKTLKPGDTLTLHEGWFQQKTAHLNVVDPSPQNNPMGSGFPGYRASNQIVAYDAQYGSPTTGTNEFGFEVTVRNGIVTSQEGSDSTIPSDGFVLSGHGKGRSWLIANAPLGAKIRIGSDQQTLSSIIDFDTYAYQFDQRWADSPCSASLWSSNGLKADPLCHQIRDQKDQAQTLQRDGKSTQAAARMVDALENLNRRTWLSYDAFPADTIRGAWHRPVEKTTPAIGKTLDTLKAAGINAVFLETFFHGYTIFPSQTYQAYGLPAQNPKFEGEDLLKLWVDEAHKRGMKVHTWFQTFYGGTKAYMPPGPILSKYPNWANVQYSALVSVPVVPPVSKTADGRPIQTVYSKPAASTTTPTAPVAMPLGASLADKAHVAAGMPVNIKKAPDKPVPSTLELGGYFLDPANPQVQEFLDKLALEIASRYDVDGIQLDYIRYPASFPADRFSFRKTTWGYTDVARKAFKAQYSLDPADIDPKDPKMATLWMAWSDFKTQQVNHFVQRVTTELHQKRPDLKISAAVFPDASAALALKQQDWQLWGRKGWIDFFAPMTLTSANKVVARDTRNMVQATDHKIPVFSGIFGPFNDNTAELILSQIDTAKQAGASGYVLFDTAHLTTRTLEALKAMQVVSHQPAVTTPAVTPAPTTAAPASQAPAKKRHWWSRK
jgi:uncharacterized lipoprotein YddW (UPF0748 family)